MAVPDRAVPELPSAAFAVTMATGILAVAAREQHVVTLSRVLVGVAGGAYCALVIAWLLHARGLPRRLSEHPDRAFGLLTFVAASSVLASAWSPLALDRVLAALTAAGWLALIGPAVRALRRCPLGEARGTWLMLTVSTESIAIAALRAWPGAPPAVVAWVATALCALGLLAYAYLAPAVAQRLLAALRARTAPRGDEWILMGALAISALAGADLAGVAEAASGWSSARSVLDVGAGVCWLAATLWLAPLVVAELRSASLLLSGGYRFERWSTVFPLGMYAVASHALDVRLGLPGLEVPAAILFVAGVLVWAATAAGLARRGVGRTP